MAKRIGTSRTGTRHKLKKHIRRKGKVSLTSYFQKFKIGEKVLLKAEPAIQKAMYFPRFHGKTGIIKGKKGNCYNILIKDNKKEKTLIVHPVHLKKV